MSDYGITIKNDDDEVQIDSTYENYFKAYEYYFIVPYHSSLISYPLDCGSIFLGTEFYEPPLIAYQPASGTVFQHRMTTKMSIPPYDWRGIYGLHQNVNTTIEQRRVDYVVCTKENPTTASGSYGLTIRNTTSGICFSSEENYLKIKGVYPITTTFNASNVKTGTYEDITVLDTLNNYYMLNDSYTCCDNGVSKGYAVGLQTIDSTTIRVKGFYAGVWSPTYADVDVGSPTILVEVGF